MPSPKQARSTTTATATRTARTRATRATNGATTAVTESKVTVKTTVASQKKTVAPSKTEVEVEKTVVATKTRKRKTSGHPVKAEEEDVEDDDDYYEQEEEGEIKPASKKRKAQAKQATAAADDEKKPPKKRRTKAEKEAQDNMILAARTPAAALGRAMFIGAHVSAAGGVQNAVQNATNIGANSFALFLKSQRKWESPPLQDSHRDEFRARLASLGYDATSHVLPHGSYLINLAQADAAKAAQAYASFVDDLKRCEALGIRLYNFHPGSTGGDTSKAACARIAAQLNRAHAETEFVVPLLECMCGSGNVVGSRFEELRDIIALVDDKTRVGVCIDTCHAFAAGYDLRTPEAFAETMREFDEVVGMKYLKALHLNDSKAPLASHRDLHANIGTGFLGLRAFHSVMNYAPFEHLPMVLETPIEVKGPDGKTTEDRRIWADEIKLLEGLIGADPESPAFEAKVQELAARGAGERARIQDQVDKKVGKDAKKAENDAKRAAKKAGGAKSKPARRKSAKKEASASELSDLSSACESCGEGSS